MRFTRWRTDRVFSKATEESSHGVSVLRNRHALRCIVDSSQLAHASILQITFHDLVTQQCQHATACACNLSTAWGESPSLIDVKCRSSPSVPTTTASSAIASIRSTQRLRVRFRKISLAAHTRMLYLGSIRHQSTLFLATHTGFRPVGKTID